MDNGIIPSGLEESSPLWAVIEHRLEQLAQADFPHRLWAHDPTLWTEDPAAQAVIRERMGWLDAPERSRALLPKINRLVKEVQLAGYTHALLLGMGGASLAAEVFGQIFGSREINGRPGLELLVLDSIDLAQVRAAARWSPVDTTLYIVSSRPGETMEIEALSEFFWARARRRLGDKAAAHFVAIAGAGTPLEKLARERKYRQVFLSNRKVSGRYSALSVDGLLPAALLGIDAAGLLSSAARMAGKCAADVPVGQNPGLLLGAVIGEAALQGRDKLTILADPPLEPFGAWLESLIAESSGKLGKGIVPVVLEPPLAPKKYANDRLFIYLKAGGDQEAFINRLRAAGQPVLTLAVDDFTNLGAKFFRWEVAAATACAILGVNAFDETNAEDTKERSARRAAAFQAVHSPDEDLPVWEGPGGDVYGWDFPGLNGSRTLADVIKAFLAQSRDGDYVAIHAFVPRNPRMLGKLQSLRAKILKTSGRATMLGFGQRFLHSTGQLLKEGRNGLYLQITQQEGADLEIPGQPLTFGTFQRAQASDDLKALLARGRRAIRIHLVEGDIKDL